MQDEHEINIRRENKHNGVSAWNDRDSCCCYIKDHVVLLAPSAKIVSMKLEGTNLKVSYDLEVKGETPMSELIDVKNMCSTDSSRWKNSQMFHFTQGPNGVQAMHCMGKIANTCNGWGLSGNTREKYEGAWCEQRSSQSNRWSFYADHLCDGEPDRNDKRVRDAQAAEKAAYTYMAAQALHHFATNYVK
eukprot:gnl/TRDRNA2_/TRDRNA2_39340_c0_seq1.p1 gnl/TRDRNA2_/TRDRNA2_39340_c0~~gnl/TRDRNA2_/TRDRNA2_39340_c0_seq1.p1  ORF type:complete len:189 (-),score=21.02 gnl/TRDRNA2_/TRDRNA2_39340_c0_seq1:51-617(-)